MYWSPKVKISFSDEELIQNLNSTRERPDRRIGNWWTFFTHLARPEQDRLMQFAEERWVQLHHYLGHEDRDAGAYASY